MKNSFIIPLAYPETIVAHANERYARLVPYFGIGNKTHIRAGHVALLLIDLETGVLEYFDFGRYTTPEKFGRVRGKETDFELNFPLKAKFKNNRIQNLKEILIFMATNPKLTHGEGTLYASVCNSINYDLAREYIQKLQDRGMVKYAAFKEEATNCARFVTNVIIASTEDLELKNKLKKSKRFTPSTMESVVFSASDDEVYKISETGKISKFDSNLKTFIAKMFLDKLENYKPSNAGRIEPMPNSTKKNHAQWLGGVGAGAWFELYYLNEPELYRLRRISPEGRVDCDSKYKISSKSFDIKRPYQFVHYSNCKFFNVMQDDRCYKFKYLSNYQEKDGL